MCEDHDAAGNCLSKGWPDGVYLMGRLKTRQIQRIAINRRPGRGQYDAIMGGTHGAFTVLVANPEARGWREEEFTQNPVAALQPQWADAKYVFEHQHPAFDANDPTGQIHTGETYAIAVDPRSGLPWFSNDWRTTNLPGYVTMPIPMANNSMRPKGCCRSVARTPLASVNRPPRMPSARLSANTPIRK